MRINPRKDPCIPSLPNRTPITKEWVDLGRWTRLIDLWEENGQGWNDGPTRLVHNKYTTWKKEKGKKEICHQKIIFDLKIWCRIYYNKKTDYFLAKLFHQWCQNIFSYTCFWTVVKNLHAKHNLQHQKVLCH